jgi:hypothetical protein
MLEGRLNSVKKPAHLVAGSYLLLLCVLGALCGLFPALIKKTTGRADAAEDCLARNTLVTTTAHRSMSNSAIAQVSSAGQNQFSE